MKSVNFKKSQITWSDRIIGFYETIHIPWAMVGEKSKVNTDPLKAQELLLSKEASGATLFSYEREKPNPALHQPTLNKIHFPN